MVYVYDFTEQKLIPLESPVGVNTSVNGLAIFGHYVAVNVVDCRTPYRLYVFDLKSLGSAEKATNGWHLIVQHEFKNKEKKRFEWSLDRFFPDNEAIPVESIYVYAPDDQTKRPLMVLVHGGPNSIVPRKFGISVSRRWMLSETSF